VKIHFYKYQATGNDFVMIDNRSNQYSFTNDQIKKLCDRKFGVGADGVLLISNHPTLDFNLVYINGDGTQSLCGNGSRAAVKMASDLGMIKGKTTFNAYDGPHEAVILPNDIIKLKMNDVKELKNVDGGVSLNTGSPHFVKFVDTLKDYPVTEEGRSIRYSKFFHPIGTNANFVEMREDNTLFVRTYERGVEEETLSCGTGVTASALAASARGYSSPVKIQVLGGELSIEFKQDLSADSAAQSKIASSAKTAGSTDQYPPHMGAFHDIFLIGPAKMVFEGEMEL
jgi:diaminopimelate epimerase